MKKVKIISTILSLVILVTSLNLGMMFTSNAANVSSIQGIINAVKNASGTSLTINVNSDIDCAGLGAFEPIDASGITITFKGGKHIISNLNLKGGGLFKNVGEGSSFNNIAFYDCYVYDFAATDKGYGILCDNLKNGTVTNTVVAGKMAIYNGGKNIGGLVGHLSGDSASVTNSFSMVDIHTDGSYVGGLIGRYTGSANDNTKIMNCYSTGTIDNGTRDSFTKNYIGGLIGYSNVSCVSKAYTTTFITAPYADTVKAIGCVPNLDSTVYYDEGISLQRQEDLDTDHRSTATTLGTKMTSASNAFTLTTGYYPQLSAITNINKFKGLSAISAAVVDINLGTGREYAHLSTGSAYNYATLTKNVGTDAGKITWQITGGVDEYYFDPDADMPTSYGAPMDGLSGNTYDVNNGKYLFVTEGDVVFTAVSGDFSRDITVHVLEQADSPYFAEGDGTSGSPFVINSAKDFDLIRLYCLDDMVGSYYYTVSSDLRMTDFADTWMPIIGMKGTLKGNKHIISDLKVNEANEGNAGLFATISATATITDLHISDAVINVEKADNAGVLAGSVKDASVTNVIASGRVSVVKSEDVEYEGIKNAGVMAGNAVGTTVLNNCLTLGMTESTQAGGGFFGSTAEGVTVNNCYSTAVVTGAKTVGGIYGTGNGAINTSIFTGMVSPGVNGLKHGLTGGNGAVDGKSYFDRQAAGMPGSVEKGAVSTAVLCSADVTLGDGWIKNNTSVNMYPQIGVFCNSDIARTAYTSAHSANVGVYEFQLTEATSVNFDKVSFNSSLYSPISTDAFDVTNDSKDDASRYSSQTANGKLIFTKTGGGKKLYALNTVDSGCPADTRYILFNVRNVKINYRFELADAPAYNVDMSERGLTDITTELGLKYGAILDSTVVQYTGAGYVNVTPSGDTLSFAMTQPFKYTYTVDAFTEIDEEGIEIEDSKLTCLDSEKFTYSIADLDEVYIRFTINTKELPWGLYRIDCGND